MLAYLFWHRPRAGADRRDYEGRLIGFHEALTEIVSESASFQVASLPFGQRAGYEDWYVVEDWAALGALNDRAVSGRLRAAHEAAAKLAGDGWGGVYRVIRGSSRPPDGTRWVSKPADQGERSFLDAEPAPAVWQRQLVLGPAPEFCLSDDRHGRRRLWPRVDSMRLRES